MITKKTKLMSPFELCFVTEAPKKSESTIIRVPAKNNNEDYTEGIEDVENTIPSIDSNTQETIDLNDDEDYSSDLDEMDDDTIPDSVDESELSLNDDEDYSTSVEGDVQAQDNQEPDTITPEESQETDDTGVSKDSVKKYGLYVKYMSLYNACIRYLDKLDSLSRDSYNDKIVIRSVTNKIRDVSALLQEYMITQYMSSSYTKSIIFYQKAIATVHLTLNLLGNINVNKIPKKKQYNKK